MKKIRTDDILNRNKDVYKSFLIAWGSKHISVQCLLLSWRLYLQVKAWDQKMRLFVNRGFGMKLEHIKFPKSLRSFFVWLGFETNLRLIFLFQNFLDICSSCIVRDFDSLIGVYILEASVSLSRYQALRKELVTKIFSPEFMDRLDLEIRCLFLQPLNEQVYHKARPFYEQNFSL